MKAKDIVKHFLSGANWVDRERTVDGVIIGDPEKDFDKCLVVWMSTFAALRVAVERGFDLVLGHEATFYHEYDEGAEELSGHVAKRRFIEEHELTIIRNHDCWDGWPEVGIPWAWAQFLGLEGQPAKSSTRYQHRYDIEPIPFGEFAKRVASRTAAIGEPAVQTVGDLDKTVSKIGIGTGCFANVLDFLMMGCDCCVVCDDGSRYDEAMKCAADLGVPVIRVNHGTSEEPGMVALTKYINDHIPGLTAEHLPQGCSFRLVGGVE